MIQIFICGGKRTEPTRCKCGAVATTRCVHPLTGPKTGQACGRHLCARCVTGGLCAPHAKLAARP